MKVEKYYAIKTSKKGDRNLPRTKIWILIYVWYIIQMHKKMYTDIMSIIIMEIF